MLSYVYPLLGLFWSMLMFSFFVAWLMLLFRIIGDIVRCGVITDAEFEQQKARILA